MDLDLILKEFDDQNREDLEVIRAVLPHCGNKIQVTFALYCCLDIEPLMTDERSINTLRAIEVFLKTGKPISQDIRTAAHAAYAANAAHAAYAANAANAAHAAY